MILQKKRTDVIDQCAISSINELLQLFLDFSSQVALLLFDTFTDFVADEALSACHPWIQRIQQPYVWVLDKVLVCQADLGQELVKTAFNDLVNDLFRLAFVQRFFLEDFAFVSQTISWNFFARHEFWG